MSLNRTYQLLFLVLVCLGVYYPALFNSTFSIDDADMVLRMERGALDWGNLFLPRTGFYYRPILTLTFWFDKWAWSFDQSFSLLENILLHASNVLLVFLIAERAFRFNKNRYVAFCAALMFAVHPIATESINWMSGRTDLLASFFILISVIALDTALRKGSYLYLALALIFIITGVMSKEVTIFFVPAALYLMFIRKKLRSDFSFSTLWKPALFLVTPFVLCSVGFVVSRVIIHGHSSYSLSRLLERIPYGVYDLFRVSFKVFGFYVKKLFFPLPLNFSIVSVSELYVLVGMIVFVLAVWMFSRHSLRWAYCLVSLYLILPAVIIAITGVAWTPIAERYIYLSAAFFSIGLVAVVSDMMNSRRNVFIGVGFFLVWVCSSLVACAQRTILWQDKQALYADTLKKSPTFNRLRNDYGVALLNNGHSNAALDQLRIGQGENGTYLARINEARLLLIEKDFEKARLAIWHPDEKIERISVRGLKFLAHINAGRLGATDDLNDKSAILQEMYVTHNLLYEKTKDPFYLYRSAQLALRNNETSKARELFKKAFLLSPKDAYYHDAAKKLSEKL